jgi:methionyl-tRNA synthetase
MLNSRPTEWDKCGNAELPAGHKLNDAEILFTKIEDKTVEELVGKLGLPEDKPVEKVEEITIDEFKKVILRVAKILSAENIKKSDKLIKLKIDLGTEQRQILAGIAQSYKPEELIGKNVLIVSNLKPAKIFGQESQGMILATETSEDGKLKIIEINDSVLPGTIAK